MQSDVHYLAFSPILRGRSFDGTRDKWTARRGPSSGRCIALEVQYALCHRALDEKFGHGAHLAVEAKRREGKDLQEGTRRGHLRLYLFRPPFLCVSGLWTDATDDDDAVQWRDLKGKDGVCMALPRVRPSVHVWGGLFKKCRIPSSQQRARRLAQVLTRCLLGVLPPSLPPSRRLSSVASMDGR